MAKQVPTRIVKGRDPLHGGSEFGGVAGLIQPVPHETTNTEKLMQIYRTEPSAPALGDPADQDFIPESQRRA